MWVCNLCRKQQEILTKSGAWFYSSAAGPRGGSEGPRGRRHEEAPQEKKAKLQQDLLYQGPPGDVSADRSRPPGLPRQGSLNNGSGLRHSGQGQDIDRWVQCVCGMLCVLNTFEQFPQGFELVLTFLIVIVEEHCLLKVKPVRGEWGKLSQRVSWATPCF